MTAIAGAIVFIVIGQTAAWADCHADGDNSGSGTGTIKAGNQSWSWNLSTRQAYVYSHADGMSLSICLDTFVDWMTNPDGHYDIRIARNCDPNSTRSGTRTEPSDWGDRNVTGLQKAGACKYFQDNEPPGTYDVDDPADCGYDPESATTGGHYCYINAASTWTSQCGAYWIRHEDGTVDYNNGGDVWDCD